MVTRVTTTKRWNHFNSHSPSTRAVISFWRDARGRQVDLVVEAGRREDNAVASGTSDVFRLTHHRWRHRR